VKKRRLPLHKFKFNNNIRQKISVFAIFDGHGGNEVSQFLSLNIESILIKYITQSNYNIKE